MKRISKLAVLLTMTTLPLLSAPIAVPENLVVEGIPGIPEDLKAEVGRYLEFRGANFNSWHPTRREMLITTRFADSTQLHYVSHPGGDRKQLTFFPEPVGGGAIQPQHGKFIVFQQDTGGGEFYQFYRFDPDQGKATLLTDGKSRNTGLQWSHDGKRIAYASTKRTGRDNDIYLMDPADPGSNRLLLELSGGGWGINDWSRDGDRLLITEYLSINESYLYRVDISSGTKTLVTPKGAQKISYGDAQFTRDPNLVLVLTDKDSEFQRLARLDLRTGQHTFLTSHIKWDVDEFHLSPDGKTIAFVANEDGVGVLHLMNAQTGKEIIIPKLPVGIVSGVEWHENGRDLAFNISSARSPNDIYSLDVKAGKVERWTESETGGLNAQNFSEPLLVRYKSFDGLDLSAFLYLPDAKKFPGKRPLLINIHGGPEGQSRPGFQGRLNYYLNEMGLAMVYPNVRGSSGYGKTFLTLDNGFKREDSVKDIGALIDSLAKHPSLDADRFAVIGGSYGGYMVLASLMHFSDRLRAGIDIVGISNFLTFLKNTQDYRRDLRRAEYGDERDPKMKEFMEKISPSENVDKIRKPLLVVQGKNDPRVPVTESEQMVKAIREKGGKVWYLMATDEGHGFAKKKNADFQALATIVFLKEFLLK